MKYSLLFLGQQTRNGTLSLDDSIDCWQQTTVALHSCLGGLDDVRYSFRENRPDHPHFYTQLPKVDAILYWGVPQVWMSYDHSRLRQLTGCRAIITICEGAIPENSDWSFAFRDSGANTTQLHRLSSRTYQCRSHL
jgi:hypothetical protein